LSSINNKFSVIGISETWLQNNNNSINLESYNFVHNCRQDRIGGGVGLYLDNSLNYKPRSDLSCDGLECVESLFVEICMPKRKGIIVGIVYRPPNQNANDFVQYINSIMTKISKENKYIYLMGDFNLNLMNHQSHQQTSEFLDVMYSNMLLPLITRPTRITAHTSTLIDNIFTNHLENSLFSGLLFTDISDHLPIFCFSYEQSLDIIDEKFVIFRDKSNSNLIKFHNQLNNTKWEDLLGFNDPETAYDCFHKKFKDIYNLSFPFKKVKTKKFSLRKPWVSNGLLKSINRKNNLYKKYLNNPCTENESKYKRYKNKLTNLLRNAKKIYYEEKIENAKTNMKDTWKILNEIVNHPKSLRFLLQLTTKMFLTQWKLQTTFVIILQILVIILQTK
jgi:hypothetical protein